MHDIIIVVISVIGSLALNAAVFRSNKTGLKESDTLRYLKTVEQQLQEIRRPLNEHEKDLSENSTYSDINSIRQDIDELKRRIVTSSTGSASGENNQQIVNLLQLNQNKNQQVQTKNYLNIFVESKQKQSEIYNR